MRRREGVIDGNRLHRQLKALVQPKLLVIDEVARSVAVEPAVPGDLSTLPASRSP